MFIEITDTRRGWYIGRRGSDATQGQEDKAQRTQQPRGGTTGAFAQTQEEEGEKRQERQACSCSYVAFKLKYRVSFT